eukprot:746161-Hanusia_phi.AAC.1
MQRDSLRALFALGANEALREVVINNITRALDGDGGGGGGGAQEEITPPQVRLMSVLVKLQQGLKDSGGTLDFAK